MNITITTSKKVATSAIRTMADTVNVIKADKIQPHQIDEALANVTTNHSTEGPAYKASYTFEEDTHICTANIDIDDEAVLMALPTIVKMAKVLAPAVGLCKAAYDLVKSVGVSIRTIEADLKSQVNSKFGRPSQFAIVPVVIEELGLTAVAMVEYTGFGKLHVRESRAMGTCHMFDAIEAYAIKAAEAAIASKDAKFFTADTKDEADWQYDAAWDHICDEHDKKREAITLPGTICTTDDEDDD